MLWPLPLCPKFNPISRTKSQLWKETPPPVTSQPFAANFSFIFSLQSHQGQPSGILPRKGRVINALISPPVGPHIGRYCGLASPGRVTSYTGILSMTITTDNAIAREGFSASYTIRERSLPHEDQGESPGGTVCLGTWACLCPSRTRRLRSLRSLRHLPFPPPFPLPSLLACKVSTLGRPCSSRLDFSLISWKFSLCVFFFSVLAFSI